MRNVGAISWGKKTVDGIWVKVRENRAWNQEREKNDFHLGYSTRRETTRFRFCWQHFCKAHKSRRICEAFFDVAKPHRREVLEKEVPHRAR